METRVISKTEADVMSRELNIKAKEAALNDIKGTDKVAPAKPTNGKPKVEKPSKGLREVTKADKGAPVKVAKVVKPKLSEHIDGLIKAGGKWEDLIQSATDFCKKNELKTKITQASFKTQVYWRRVVQKNPEYMIDMELTDKGISKVAKSKVKAKK